MRVQLGAVFAVQFEAPHVVDMRRQVCCLFIVLITLLNISFLI